MEARAGEGNRNEPHVHSREGTVGVEERRCGVGNAYKAQGLWEQYFMGSNKLAIIEAKPFRFPTIRRNSDA